MKTRKLLGGIALLLIMTFVAACSSDTKSEAEGTDFLVSIETDYGTMKAILHDETPLHKENFLKLAKEDFYDSLLFHRVINGFMIQGGDPASKNAAPGQPLGSGGPGYTVDAEILPELFHKKGALAAARRGGPANPEKKSSGSQFYIVQGFVHTAEQVQFNQAALGQCISKLRQENPEGELMTAINEAFQTGGNKAGFEKVMELQEELIEATGIDFTIPQARVDAYTTQGGVPNLDGEYTVFGQVIDGLDVIDKIAAVATAPGDRPLEDVRMKVTVEEMSKSDISSQYGYQYK